MSFHLDLQAQACLPTSRPEILRQQLVRSWLGRCEAVVEEEGAVILVCAARHGLSAHTVMLIADPEALRIELWADDWESLTAILAALITAVSPAAVPQRKTA